MKLQLFAIASLLGLIIYSCSSSKRAATSSNSASVPVEKKLDPLSPTDVEVTALSGRFSDLTLATLSEGYAIYSGPCTNCHKQMDIYSRNEDSWKHAIDNMAPKAKITDSQKDALWKYVLAMKASHPSQNK